MLSVSWIKSELFEINAILADIWSTGTEFAKLSGHLETLIFFVPLSFLQLTFMSTVGFFLKNVIMVLWNNLSQLVIRRQPYTSICYSVIMANACVQILAEIGSMQQENDPKPSANLPGRGNYSKTFENPTLNLFEMQYRTLKEGAKVGSTTYWVYIFSSTASLPFWLSLC